MNIKVTIDDDQLDEIIEEAGAERCVEAIGTETLLEQMSEDEVLKWVVKNRSAMEILDEIDDSGAVEDWLEAGNLEI